MEPGQNFYEAYAAERNGLYPGARPKSKQYPLNPPPEEEEVLTWAALPAEHKARWAAKEAADPAFRRALAEERKACAGERLVAELVMFLAAAAKDGGL